MIKEFGAKRAKYFLSGGGPSYPWGGLKFSWMGGGQGLIGEDSPFMGYGPPPIPPMLASLVGWDTIAIQCVPKVRLKNICL